MTAQAVDQLVGPHRPKCRAKAKSTGRQCTNWPIKGGTVCTVHGGKARQVMAKAQRARDKAAADQLVGKTLVQMGLGNLPDVSGEQALIDEVRRSASTVAVYEAQVSTLTIDEAPVSGLVKLWNDERDRLTRVAIATVRAGIDERRVQVAERDGQAVWVTIQRILAGLDLTPDQQRLVPVIVPQALRQLGQETGD